MNVSKYGIYLLRDNYFADFPDPCLKGNHSERRPHYFACVDARTGLWWFIPISSRQSKLDDYARRTKNGRPCDVFHPVTLGGREGVLLIADMFPVIEKYIKGPYTISGGPVVFKDTGIIKAIERKTRKVMVLLRRGVKFTPTQPDVFLIEKQLILMQEK
jgi:hypothetical protein